MKEFCLMLKISFAISVRVSSSHLIYFPNYEGNQFPFTLLFPNLSVGDPSFGISGLWQKNSINCQQLIFHRVLVLGFSQHCFFYRSNESWNNICGIYANKNKSRAKSEAVLGIFILGVFVWWIFQVMYPEMLFSANCKVCSDSKVFVSSGWNEQDYYKVQCSTCQTPGLSGLCL